MTREQEKRIEDLCRRLRLRPLSTRLRFRILERDRFRCVYCGRGGDQIILHVDHVVARVDGGGDEPSNLVTACRECNLGKRELPLGKTPLSTKGLVTVYGPYRRDRSPEASSFRVVVVRGRSRTSRSFASEDEARLFKARLLTDENTVGLAKTRGIV